MTIQNNGRKTDIIVDQTLPLAAGEAFRTIGSVELDGGVETVITVSNTGTDGFVILDALQLIEANN